MTSLAIPLSPVASSLARKLHGTGYVLIAVAFALPFLAIPFGYSTAFQAGESLVHNLLALFVFALIAWLTTRKRSDMAKALAQFLSGILMCLFVGSNFAGVGIFSEEIRVV
jgi:asparagine N-glycosylation enzyme membrane subunit Stt3